ncbi:MAG: protein kinase domain-containing protein [Desulfitobacteriaceae bacterium]
MLKIGDSILCENSKETYVIKKKLGEGGQGAVYLVENGNSTKVLKWYLPKQATDTQRANISKLIMKPLKGEAGKRFIWPQDIATAETDQESFGYLMELIDTSKFAELGEVQAKLKPRPSFKAMCQISYQLANSYKLLHLAGNCYSDISTGNFMFDPKRGDVLICDNDNVGVNGQIEAQVLGTIEFMAPEIIMGQTKPSNLTDQHSLAVLLFNFWIWHHPFHGLKEYNLRSWDIPAKKKVYGEEPVFMFDPQDKSNAVPNDPDYKIVERRWKVCPDPIKDLFVKAFTVGLKNPHNRVTEEEWQRVFSELEESIIECPSCHSENFWWYGVKSLTCWNCQKPIKLPIRLIVKNARGIRSILLHDAGVKLLEVHLDPFADPVNANNVAGGLKQNPNNPTQWGLANLTATTWTYKLKDGTVKEAAPQKSIPLNAEIEITFRNNVTGMFEI